MSDLQPLTITDLHLRTLLDAAPIGMLVVNHREEVILANPIAERLFGQPPHDGPASRGAGFFRCLDRLTARQGCGNTEFSPPCPLVQGLRSALAGTATPADLEGDAQLERGPGCAPLWVRYTIRLLVIDGKRGVLLSIADISSQRLSEQRYTMLFREMFNAFALHEIICDGLGQPTDYRYLAVNPAFERMTGLVASQIIGRTVLGVLPHTEPFWIETYGRVALTGEPARFEHFSREIGKHFAIHAFCPAPGQFACLFDDITERKLAREALETSEAKYRSAYTLLRSMCDNVPDMIWAKDLDKRYLFANAALCRDLLNATDTGEPIGQSDLIFAERERRRHPDQPHWHTFGELCRDSDAATMEAGTPRQFDEFGNVRGQFLFLDVHKAPFLDENGVMIGTVGSARDVTGLKAMEQQLREREQSLDLAIRGADLGTWDCHIPSGAIVINDRWAEMLGYSVEEIRPHLDSWLALVHPDDRVRVNEALTRHVRGETDGYETEHRLRHASGEWIWVLAKGRVIERDAQGKPLRACGTHLDITQRKILIEQSRDGIVILDHQGKVREANRRFADMLGYTPEEVQDLHVWEWEARWTREQVLEAIVQIDAAGDFFETIHRRKDGTTYPVEISSNGSIWAGDKQVFCICRDITERRRAEQQIRESRDFLHTVLNAIPARVFWKDLDLRYLGCNLAFARDAGCSAPEELIGKDDFALTWRDQASWYQAVDREVITQGITKMLFEEEQTTPTGERIHLLTSKLPLKNAEGATIGVLGVYSDITERKRAEERLRESEAHLRESEHHFRTLANSGLALIWTSGPDKLCNYFNESWLRYTGRALEQELGNGWAEGVHPDDYDRCLDIYVSHFDRRQPFSMEYRLRKASGEYGWILDLGNPRHDSEGNFTGYIGYCYDITDRKRAEEEKKILNAQLQQAQKLEAIGTLAGGIAHDFNNILGAIVGYSEMIREDFPPGSRGIHDIDQVLKASDRAKDLVKQILAFSRQAEDQKIPMKPAAVVKEAIALLRSSLPTTITIKQDIDADAGMVLASPTQIHQIVMNLATNAFHAMEVEGGTLTIALQKKILCQDDLATEPDLQPGAFVQLSVIDTGKGIPPEIRDKIYDPFFTTKEVGKGTGLGLSMVYSIVKSCQGSIVCASRLGAGAEFRIILPALENHAMEDGGAADLIPSGKEHILLIDDEEVLVELGQVMLERLGYHVTTRTSSLDALTTFQNHPDDFDLIITDQTMPSMTGIDLARQMLQIRPRMPIILCTGYSSQITEDMAKVAGIKGFAFKPLAKKDIGELIRKVLDGKNP